MDQEAIESLKRHYTSKLLRRIIASGDDNYETPTDNISTLKQVTIKDIIYMTAAAWEEVTYKWTQ